MKKTSSKTLMFSIGTLVDAANVTKSFAKFLRDIGALDFGSVGKIEISVEFESYENDRQTNKERR